MIVGHIMVGVHLQLPCKVFIYSNCQCAVYTYPDVELPATLGSLEQCCIP